VFLRRRDAGTNIGPANLKTAQTPDSVIALHEWPEWESCTAEIWGTISGWLWAVHVGLNSLKTLRSRCSAEGSSEPVLTSTRGVMFEQGHLADRHSPPD